MKIIGYFYVVISAIAFSTLAILGRLAYDSGVDTFTLLFLRFAIAFGIMLFIMALKHESIPERNALVKLAGMGGIGYVAQSFCFLTAVRYASAGLVAFLLYLYPVFVAILSAVFLKKRISWQKWLALLIALIGIGLTVNPQGGQPLGIALAIASALIYSVYILTGSSVLRTVTALQSSTVIFGSAGVVFGILMCINGSSFPTTSAGWYSIIAMSLISTVIPVFTFLAGMKYVGPTNASMLSTIEPVVTVLLAGLFLEELLQPVILLGGILILVAAWIVIWSDIKTNRNSLKATSL